MLNEEQLINISSFEGRILCFTPDPPSLSGGDVFIFLAFTNETVTLPWT